jgi:hypothetical protein
MPEPEPINPKDWIELAKIAQARTFNRRAMEWKLAFGLWTAIAGFTACFFTNPQISIPSWTPWALGIAYSIIGAIVVVCWQLPMRLAYQGDLEWFKYYTLRAQGATDAKRPDQVEIPYRWTPRTWAWFIGESMLSIVLMALSWVAVTFVAMH